MSWIKVKDFEETLEEFIKNITEKSEEELIKEKWIDSGYLWWDKRHNQYVFLRAIIEEINEGVLLGKLVWVGNGLTAYDGCLEFEGKQGLIEILENIDEYFDF